MSFFTRLSNGWNLAKLSFATINKNKTLLLFPLFSTISLILVLITFFGGAFFIAGDEIGAVLDNEQYGNAVALSFVFVYYLINFFIIVFFNSALIHCAIKLLNGEETSLSDGLTFSLSRIGKIFSWSVLSATVGTLLQLLQETGKLGQIIASVIGVAWSILTFFVVPILVYEDKGVFESIRDSGRLMKQKWGESLAANASFGILHFIGIVVAGLFFYLLASVHIVLAIITGLLLVLLISTVISAAQTVFVAAVYNHVVGKPTGDFDDAILDNAFVAK